MNENLFIRDQQGNLLEGPLSDKPTKLLFVLKEPHGNELNCFWMREKVMERTEGTLYYNVIGAFAKKIIGDSHHSSLEQSAFINLFPFEGLEEIRKNEETGKSYVDLIEEWKKGKIDLKKPSFITSKSNNREILCNRLQIIKSALDNGISVVAYYKIADLLYRDENFDFSKLGYYTKEPYQFCCYQYGNTAKLYEMLHPRRRPLPFENLKNALEIESVYP